MDSHHNIELYQQKEERQAFKRYSQTFDRTLRDRELLEFFEGETFSGVNSQFRGTLFESFAPSHLVLITVTNFRLIIKSLEFGDVIWIPLTTIYNLKREGSILTIYCKDLRILKLSVDETSRSYSESFGTGNIINDSMKQTSSESRATVRDESGVGMLCALLRPYIEISNIENLFAFSFKLKSLQTPKEDGWEIYNPIAFFKAMLDTPEAAQYWVISEANKQFTLCPTYPRYLVVPRKMNTKKILRETAGFRSKQRLPVLCWKHPSKPITITRCSQPKIGITRQCKSDEALLNAIRESNHLSQTLYIIDCRPKVTALGNAISYKGGYESSSYTNCKILFMNIENFRQMRESWQKLFDIVRRHYKSDDFDWLSDLHATQWLKHIQLLLKAAIEIVKLIEYENASVLIHCSDGWDRTPQLTSLVQLIIDPFYRTIRGFEILIEKEWCSFGHRFATRCGHAPKKENGNEDDDWAPIFIQWLDCVWQLLTQFPAEFEFNEEFLIFIADAVYSCQYGTFLCDSECERLEIKSRTVSVWTFANLPENISHFMNPFYKEKCFSSLSTSIFEMMPSSHTSRRRISVGDNNVLWASSSPKVIKFWESYWLRWDPEFRVIAKTNENIKNYIQKLRKQNTELEQKVKKLMKAKTDESSLQQQPQQQQSSQSQFQPESIRLREDSVTTPSNFYFELV